MPLTKVKSGGVSDSITLTSPDINAPDIDGGTIDNAVIGGSTAAAGSFTTITATGGSSSNWNTAYGWGDHSTQSYATQTYVGTEVSNLVDSSPAALDTLNELAAALGDDPNFATTVTNSIALKAPLASPSFTGTASATNVSLPDDGVLSLGTSDELTLKHHNSGYSHLINTTGTLYVDSDSVTFRDDDGSPSNMVISQTGIDVTGTATMDGLTVDGNAGIGGSTITDVNLLNIQGSGASKNIGVVFNDTNTSKIFAIQNGGSALKVFDYTASAERMRIDSSGNVGIGRTDPQQLLEVHKAAGGDQTVAKFSAHNYGDTGKTYIEIGTEHGDGSSRIGSFNDTGNKSVLIFDTHDAGSGSFAERMRITSSGLLEVQHDAYDGMQRSLTLSNPRNAAGSGDGTSIYFNNTGTSTIARSAYIGSVSETNYGQSNTLVFGTSSGGNAPTEAMRIDSNKTLLVGTTNDSSSVGEGIKLKAGNSAKTVSVTSSNSTSASEGFTMWSTGANAWRFYVGWGGKINATSNTIQAISDQRFKENIRDLDDGLSKVMELRPRKFDWKEGKGADIKDDRGFIAQEFEEVFPDLVGEWKDEAPEGEEPYKAVSQDLIPTLVKAIQEQQTLIESLTTRIAALEA